jgi:hypothetical protein
MVFKNAFKQLVNGVKTFQAEYHPPDRKRMGVIQDMNTPITEREKRYHRRNKVRRKVIYIITGKRT